MQSCFSTEKFVNRPQTSVSQVHYQFKDTGGSRDTHETGKKTPGGALGEPGHHTNETGTVLYAGRDRESRDTHERDRYGDREITD